MHRASCTEVEAERQAQFYYNFYAARQALDNQQYDQAYSLFMLCQAIVPTDGQTQDYLGLIYDAIGNHDKAKEFYARAYEYAPAELYKHHLNVLMEDKRIDEALTVAQLACKDNPKDPDAWNSLMQIALQADDYKSANQAIRQLEQLLGYSRYIAWAQYSIIIQQGTERQAQRKKALHALDKYLNEDPTDIPFLQQKALVLETIRHSDDRLIEVYQTILALDEDNALILNNYAYYLATHEGDLLLAEQMSFRATQLQPENSSFLDTYGWILHLKGRDSLAKFYLQKALDVAQDNTEINVIRKHLEQIK